MHRHALLLILPTLDVDLLGHAWHVLAFAKYFALHRKLCVFGANALAGGSAQATPAPDVYLPFAHAEHALATSGVE